MRKHLVAAGVVAAVTVALTIPVAAPGAILEKGPGATWASGVGHVELREQQD